MQFKNKKNLTLARRRQKIAGHTVPVAAGIQILFTREQTAYN
jgi:hypothetical protein